MLESYNVYCDESCHLEKDSSDIMILGAIHCPEPGKREIYNDIRNIKIKHGLSSYFEIKWTKVSKSKIDFYLDLLDYFFQNEKLSYRGIVATGKKQLNHKLFNNGDYDLWYYKMYFLMLDPIIKPTNIYKIQVDIKDTRGGKRVNKLREVLCNNIYDFNRDVIKSITQVNSKESELIQLVDLINGALSFYHRKLYLNDNSNEGKTVFIDRLEEHVNLNQSTARDEQKFNFLIWKPLVLGGFIDG